MDDMSEKAPKKKNTFPIHRFEASMKHAGAIYTINIQRN